MKKILFLLLFLQVNLVFGQIKQSVHLRESNSIYSVDEYRQSDEIYKGSVKKVKHKSRFSKGEANYDKSGKLINCKVVSKKQTSWLDVKYDSYGNLMHEKITCIIGKKDIFIDDFQYFRYTPDSMLLFVTRSNTNRKNEIFLDALTFEIINQKLKKKSIYNFQYDCCEKEISVLDTVFKKKMLCLNGAKSLFEDEYTLTEIAYDSLNRPTRFAHADYPKRKKENSFPKDPTEISFAGVRMIRRSSINYTYTGDKTGEYKLLFGNDGIQETFKFELCDFDKIHDINFRLLEDEDLANYKFDKKGNWIFFKQKQKYRKVKIKRKIQYYD
jgi:hypothetical protein